MIRIPSDALPPPTIVGPAKTSDTPPPVGPVGNVTEVVNDLAGSPPRQSPPGSPSKGARAPDVPSNDSRFANPYATHHRQHDASATPETPGIAPAVAVERRKTDRRAENRPVLLDTRTQRGRRMASDDAGINIKV
ncbi:MAG TPA: hypothetical protein PLS67_09280 [Accumulibacter sp.]|jgi:hypothetical protein|nr:hypothetical protein [Accumulibacter sp.]HQC80696.1 hypothetical protein [Accumulibacter sp.]